MPNAVGVDLLWLRVILSNSLADSTDVNVSRMPASSRDEKDIGNSMEGMIADDVLSNIGADQKTIGLRK